MENLLRAAEHGLSVPNEFVGRPGTPRPGQPRGAPAAAAKALPGALFAQTVRAFPAVPTFPAAADSPSPSKRPRKQRAENWSEREVLELAEAKRILTEELESAADPRALMTTDSMKWQRISTDLLRAAVSPCIRDASACKSKWNLVIQEYKRIVDFHARTGTNEPLFWSLTPQQRKIQILPRAFHESLFTHIHSWYGRRPSVQPPHSRDLLSADDSNYRTPVSTNNQEDHDMSSHEDSDDTRACPMLNTDSEEFTGSTPSPPMKTAFFKQSSLSSDPISPMQPATALLIKGKLPVGVSPILLSSSDTAQGTQQRRASNTGVRRKTVSGHALIANATKSSGDAMTEQLKVMTEASRETEQNRINLQLKFFTEQMDYQLWRDERLQDNARAVNDNAKLAIQKQSELITCLSQLSSVLSAGLVGTRKASLCEHAEIPPKADDLPRTNSF